MGSLARRGIVGGKLVPVDGLLSEGAGGAFDAFTRRVFDSLGYLDVAQKVSCGSSLTVSEISRLLAEAPLPVLVKLVELRCGELVRTDPYPIVVLPLKDWLSTNSIEKVRQLASSHLCSLPFETVLVVFDCLELERLESGLPELLHSIASCRRGVDLVGPPAEDILSWVADKEGTSTSAVSVVELIGTLQKLRKAGLRRLRTSQKSSMISFMHQSGFPTSLMTCIDTFENHDELAKEFLRVNELSGEASIIDLWFPALSHHKTGTLHDAVTDMKILRALAVGTICLTNIPKRRASSRYLSLEAINFARFCGANEFGVGAANSVTAQRLSLEPWEDLVKVVPTELSSLKSSLA